MQKILAMILSIGLMFNTFFGLLGEKYVVTENIRYGEADALCREISPVTYVNGDTIPSLFAYAGNDPIVTRGNRKAMEKTFSEVFGENGNGYRYVFYPFSGHGLLLDPISEECYYKALDEYCKTYFGY